MSSQYNYETGGGGGVTYHNSPPPALYNSLRDDYIDLLIA